MSVTMKDIASAAGVNASTVSRALRGDPRITRETREKICMLADEFCYVPNRSARQLAGGKTGIIAVSIGIMNDELIVTAADALQKELDEYGYMAVVLPGCARDRGVIRMLRMFEQHFCDGAILYSPNGIAPDSPEIKHLIDEKFPVVCIDQWLDYFPFPAITNDAENSIEELGRRMCECGINCALIHFPGKNTVGSWRKKEAEKFMQRNHIPYVTELDELPQFVRSFPHVNLGVMADNPAIGNLDELLAGTPLSSCIGGMFDSWKYNAPKCFDRIFLCIQDMKKTGKTAGEYIVRMLRGDRNIPQITRIHYEDIIVPYLK